jgi:hypothetical protein
MSEGFSNPLVGGSGGLVYPSIHSPGFIPGSVGWSINKDGTAEFNNGIFRGDITNGGIFTYNGTPALGNKPVFSITRPGVTADRFGNPVIANAVTTYNAFGAVINCMSITNSGFFQYRDLGSATQGILILSIASTGGNDPVNGVHYDPGMFGQDPFGNAILTVGSTIQLFNALIVAATGGRISIAAAGVPAANPYIKVDAPEQGGIAGHLQMLLQGTSPNGANRGQLLVGQVNGVAGLLAAVTNSMMEVQSNVSSNDPTLTLITLAAPDPILGSRVLGDANNRIRIDTSANANRVAIKVGPGVTTQDTFFNNSAAAEWTTSQLKARVGGATEVDNSLGTIGFGNLSLDVATFRMLPDGRVFLSVKAHATGAITANTFTFTVTLPAAYRPTTTTELPIIMPGGVVNRISIAPTGVVSMTLPALVLNNRVTCQAAYDLQ